MSLHPLKENKLNNETQCGFDFTGLGQYKNYVILLTINHVLLLPLRHLFHVS